MINAEILKQWTAQALSMRPYYNKMFPPSPYYRFFEVLTQNVKPNLSVELGVSGGGGSLHLALGWSKGKVMGVDIMYDHHESVSYVVKRCPNFELWHGDSVESAESIYKGYGEVDILFIDTTHTYDQTMKEYRAFQPYLSDNAIICLDDLFRPEGMQQAWDEMPEPKLRLDMLHDGAEFGGGFGVVWKNTQ